MTEPPIWSSNWMRNFERLEEWTRAIITMCEISDVDYKHLKSMCVCDIEDTEVQEVLAIWSPNFGLLPTWIEQGLLILKDCERIPVHCRPECVTFEKGAWQKHILEERTNVADILKTAKALLDDIVAKVGEFRELESSGEYSSYSDYTEETESDDDEDEDDDDDEEEDEDEEQESPQPRKARPRKK